jgi:acetyl esterase/lipase
VSVDTCAPVADVCCAHDLLVSAILLAVAAEPAAVLLWPGGAPGAVGSEEDADRRPIARRPVRPENGVAFYLALRRAMVPAEMHIYERGRHGLGLAAGDPVVSTWTERLRDRPKLRGAIR